MMIKVYLLSTEQNTANSDWYEVFPHCGGSESQTAPLRTQNTQIIINNVNTHHDWFTPRIIDNMMYAPCKGHVCMCICAYVYVWFKCVYVHVYVHVWFEYVYVQ